MCTRGQVAKGAFGYYKDTNGEPYNFVLTSIQYSEEDAQSPILLQSSSLLEQQRHEGAGVPHLPGSELKLMSIHGVTYLPQQYSIYIVSNLKAIFVFLKLNVHFKITFGKRS